jgi:drug/metabolite transporter (DMT)-like permease
VVSMLPRLALATTIVLWASAFPAIRAALEGYSAAHLSVLRLLVAAVVLGCVAAARGVRLPARRDLPAIAGLGLTGMAAYQLLLNSGERTVPAGTASLIVNVSPVIVALVATTVLGERLTRAGWAGIGIAFGGVTIIALTGEGGVQLSAGALLVLGAAVVQAAYFVGCKPLLARYDALELTAWAMAFGALITLPLAPGLPAAIADAPLESSAAVALLALGASAVGFVAWAYALQHIDVSIAAATLYGVPPIAILVGWAWLGELPGISSLAGGAVALAGVALVTRRGRLAPDAEAPDHEERALADGAGAGQDAELDGRAPEVVERAHVQQPLVAQLAVEDDVDDEEAVRGAVAADRVAVGAEQLRGRDGVAPVRQPLPGALQARVGEGAPQLLRM